MAVLTANREIPHKGGKIISMPAAVDILYKNAIACINAAGFVIAGSDVTAQWFCGVVVEKVDNSGGSAGDKEVPLYQEGVFQFAATGMADDDLGDLAYVLDDQTVGLLAQSSLTTGVLVGKIVRINSATSVDVDIRAGTAAVTISAT